MFWYVGVFISGLLAGFGAIWRCNHYHKVRENRKLTEYSSPVTSPKIASKEKFSTDNDNMSNKKDRANDNISLSNNSQFPILDGLASKKKADLLNAEPVRRLDTADILEVVSSENFYFQEKSPNCNKVITLSDTEDSTELYEVTTHNDNSVIHFSI